MTAKFAHAEKGKRRNGSLTINAGFSSCAIFLVDTQRLLMKDEQSLQSSEKCQKVAHTGSSRCKRTIKPNEPTALLLVQISIIIDFVNG